MTTTTQEEVYSDFPIDMSNFWPPLSPGFDWTWSWNELDDNENPRDTTGWTAEMDLRASPNGPLIKKLSTATGEIVNDNSGKFTVTYLGSANSIVSARKLVTNIKVTDAAAHTNNEFKGSIEVEEVVTR